MNKRNLHYRIRYQSNEIFTRYAFFLWELVDQYDGNLAGFHTYMYRWVAKGFWYPETNTYDYL